MVPLSLSAVELSACHWEAGEERCNQDGLESQHLPFDVEDRGGREGRGGLPSIQKALMIVTSLLSWPPKRV